MRRISSALSAFVLTATLAGCSDNGSGSDATGGSGNTPKGGSTSSGGSTTTGGTGGSTATGGTGGSTATGGTGGSSTGGGGTFKNTGVCGQRNESIVTTSAFAGYEEFYIIGEEGFGEDVCVVRYDVKRVGPAADPAGCTAAAFTTPGEECKWTHEVQLSNPKVMVNVDGACENSEIGLDAAKIASLDMSKTTYGFAAEAAGHVSLVLRYQNAKWGMFTNGTWDPDTGEFGFDRRNGVCGYGR